MAATLKLYHVKWADGRETTVKLNEEDVQHYRDAGAEVTDKGKYDAQVGRAGVTKEEADKARADAEQKPAGEGQLKADQPANKASQPAGNK